eukprot:scaffold10685_cov77-Cylindrotheca_fusiformis.AAC.2
MPLHFGLADLSFISSCPWNPPRSQQVATSKGANDTTKMSYEWTAVYRRQEVKQALLHSNGHSKSNHNRNCWRTGALRQIPPLLGRKSSKERNPAR